MENAIPIDVSPHYSLNTKKGVIGFPDIKDCTDDGILEGLKAEGVIKLDRILVFRDGQRKPTGTFILAFQSQTLPKYIRVGLLQGGCVTVYPESCEMLQVSKVWSQ